MGKTFYVKIKILREIIEIFSYVKFLKFSTPQFFSVKSKWSGENIQIYKSLYKKIIEIYKELVQLNSKITSLWLRQINWPFIKEDKWQ